MGVQGSAPPLPFIPCPTSLELRRVARHQKLAVATAMQNSRMVKMSSTMEIPFPASSMVGKTPSATPRRKKPHGVEPTPCFGVGIWGASPPLSPTGYAEASLGATFRAFREK